MISKPDLAADAARPAASSSHTDAQDTRTAAALEVGQPAAAREAPVARLVEGKVIRFPAQRKDDEPVEPSLLQPTEAAAPAPEPEPAPATVSSTQSLSDALRESAAAAAAAEAAAAAVPPAADVAHPGPPAAAALLAGMVTLSSGPAPSDSSGPEPTIAQRAEPASFTSTAILGSPAESGPQPSQLAPGAATPLPLPAAAVAAAASPEPEPEPLPLAPSAVVAAASGAAADSSSVEDVHDEFFSAGEAGIYVGGPISEAPSGHGEAPDQDFDELSAQGRRVIHRTPEQEARRERNIKVVSGLVGVGLAIACVALWRSHRAGSATELAPPAPLQISNEARPLAPEPAAPALIPAPPAAEAAPPAAEAAPPAAPRATEPPAPVAPPRAAAVPAPPAPAARPTPATPAPPRPEVESRPRPAKPAAASQPTGTPEPAPRATSSKPPTAAFPL